MLLYSDSNASQGVGSFSCAIINCQISARQQVGSWLWYCCGRLAAGGRSGLQSARLSGLQSLTAALSAVTLPSAQPSDKATDLRLSHTRLQIVVTFWASKSSMCKDNKHSEDSVIFTRPKMRMARWWWLWLPLSLPRATEVYCAALPPGLNYISFPGRMCFVCSNNRKTILSIFVLFNLEQNLVKILVFNCWLGRLGGDSCHGLQYRGIKTAV